MRLNIRLPSPATAISLFALVIALGGTAVATAPTLVKIGNNTGTNVVAVDGVGHLATSATPAPARQPYFGFASLGVGGSGDVLLTPTTSTFALTDVTFSNNYTNTVGARVYLSQVYTSSSTNCYATGATSKVIGVYYAQPGQSISASFPHGLVLRPATAGQHWCLVATSYLKGNPSGSFYTELNYNGYVAAGTL